MVMENEVIPPPYVITDTDKRGLVVVITAATLSFVWTCLLIRSWTRMKTREWRSDDYFLAAATVLDTVQSALMFHIVDEGLGSSQESLSQSDLNRIGKDEFAAQILYILTLLFSKCAVLFLYLRLSPDKGHTLASWATIAVSSVWAVASIILIAVPCNPASFWSNGPEKCANIWPRWQAIGAIDIITEAVIFLISVYLVAKLNMKMKAKVVVVTAFSARLPVILAAALRLHYLHATLDSTDRSLEGSYYIVATQWHIGYAIMSTTITGLGPFLRPFSKSFSTSYKDRSYGPQRSNPDSSLVESHTKSGNHGPVSYQMQPLRAQQITVTTKKTSTPDSDSSRSLQDHGQTLTLRPDSEAFRRNTAVTGGGRAPSAGEEEDAVSRMSNESQQWIIKKKTELRVEHDRASTVSRA